MKALIEQLLGSAAKALAGWQGYAAAAGVAFIVGFGGCWQLRDWMAAEAKAAAAKAELAAVQHVVVQERKQDAVTTTSGAAHATADQTLQAQGRQVAQEIPKHVTPKIDAAYPLPAGAVRVLNRAIGDVPRLPDAASQPDDAPSAVGVSAASSVLAGDLNACRRNGQQLTDLQGWVIDQLALARADGR